MTTSLTQMHIKTASLNCIYEIASAADSLIIPLKASTKCETVNQPDGSCKDYAYVQIFNQGQTKPLAKKRFYLNLKEATTCK